MAPYPGNGSFGADVRPPDPPRLRRMLLDWYDEARRELPWRARSADEIDPYKIWLSEIMLQQTTTVTVAGYWRAFLARWPRLQDLAAAAPEEVLHAWQGLGYYARARNLHACASRVVERHGGRFPAEESALLALPGIGAYTAAAIAAIAFDRPAVPVDGNVVRVLARLHALEAPLPAARGEITRLAGALAAAERPGDFAQALMDLGATVCTPRRPDCRSCPWRSGCAARRAGDPEGFPRAASAAAKPTRWGVVFWAERADGCILVRPRPPRGLLGGMTEFPSTPWRDAAWAPGEAAPLAPVVARWVALPGEVRHTFTHFHLRLNVLRGRCTGSPAMEKAAPAGGVAHWCRPADFSGLALPTLMKKVAKLVEAARRAPSLLADLQES